MRFNIFSIPQAEAGALKTKLASSRLEAINTVEQDGWTGTFYYSKNPLPGDVDWARTYRSLFGALPLPKNTNYYAVFLFEKDGKCYGLSYGKSHFYLRPFCDYDFGIELAKRIANEKDIKQTASKRFQGKKKKDIKSYAPNTALDVESGESVEYLQAGIIKDKRDDFGKAGKFGASALLSPKCKVTEIGEFLTKVTRVMNDDARFKLPRTTTLTEQAEIERYDELLINELVAPIGTTEFTHNSYDLYGIDFVFTNDGSFRLWHPNYPDIDVEDLSIKELKNYITSNNIPRDDVLGIMIEHQREGQPTYSSPIKESIDFIADGENVLLSAGKWMKFNQDYLEFLDEYLQSISVEDPEPAFEDISVTEPEFNASEAVRSAGYQTADKNFDILRANSATPIEAWDLSKDNRVYAVKFGTAQKLNYVCDQAVNVLELLRNRAGVGQIPNFEKYCLWIGYRAKGRLTDISESGSIILKQKIETWARKCRELGIEPVIKISRKVKPGVDQPDSDGSGA